MSTRGVVGQIDSQHYRQDQNCEETDQKRPGSGHLQPVTSRAAIARVQGFISPSRPGHVPDKVSVADQSVGKATCTKWDV